MDKSRTVVVTNIGTPGSFGFGLAGVEPQIQFSCQVPASGESLGAQARPNRKPEACATRGMNIYA